MYCLSIFFFLQFALLRLGNEIKWKFARDVRVKTSERRTKSGVEFIQRGCHNQLSEIAGESHVFFQNLLFQILPTKQIVCAPGKQLTETLQIKPISSTKNSIPRFLFIDHTISMNDYNVKHE